MEVEERIVDHLSRWVEPKRVQRGLEVGRMMTGKNWIGFEQWVIDRLNEARPDWRDYYSWGEGTRISRDDQLWLSETTIATSHARVALADWRTRAEKRAEAEQLIADAREEARRRGLLPILSRTFLGDADTYIKCEIDENGRLFLPERWHGWKQWDHNPT
jgi:hypothetical protein